jgi:hypothetical protein
MMWTRVAASLAICALLVPAISIAQNPDEDIDGVSDENDNCSRVINWGQDDSDNDDCGNLCDADYDNDGIVGFTDFGEFLLAFLSNDEEKCHVEPIPGCSVGFPDFGFFVSRYLRPPGPSGPTLGTTACP